MVTKCKDGKEKNKNGRCVKKCRDLFERNSAGKCKKVKTQKVKTPPRGYMLNLLTNRFIKMSGPTGRYILGESPRPNSMGVLTSAQKKLVDEMRSKIRDERHSVYVQGYIEQMFKRWERDGLVQKGIV